MTAILQNASRWFVAPSAYLASPLNWFGKSSRFVNCRRRSDPLDISLTYLRPRVNVGRGTCVEIGRLDKALQVWCQTLSSRDPDTYAHSERVAVLAVAVGRVLGLDDATLLHLQWGALLHDLGKVRVPEHILHKRSALSEEEWGVMRQHPVWGYEIVKALSILPTETLDVVRYHHERWDGDGYPDGLAGEEIPLLARILGVVDTWDAMISMRPYHAPMSPRKVCRYLLQQAGTALDAAIVETFVQMIEASAVLGAPVRRAKRPLQRPLPPLTAPYRNMQGKTA